MNGIIFFEDGTVRIIGKLNTVRGIALAIQNTMPDLIAQEKEQVIDSLSEKEIKAIIDRYAQKQMDDE